MNICVQQLCYAFSPSLLAFSDRRLRHYYATHLCKSASTLFTGTRSMIVLNSSGSKFGCAQYNLCKTFKSSTSSHVAACFTISRFSAHSSLCIRHTSSKPSTHSAIDGCGPDLSPPARFGGGVKFLVRIHASVFARSSSRVKRSNSSHSSRNLVNNRSSDAYCASTTRFPNSSFPKTSSRVAPRASSIARCFD